MRAWKKPSKKAKLETGGLFLLPRYVAAMNQTYLVGLLAIWPQAAFLKS
jgi:hypothetical protein